MELAGIYIKIARQCVKVKLLLILALIHSVNISSQFPPPTNFLFTYDYIMIDHWGVCDNSTIYGPSYCSYFLWEAPDTSITEATLSYYNLYCSEQLIASVTDTFYTTNSGFIGELYVTAIYSDPDGESAASNIVINNDLPISIATISKQESFNVFYNPATENLIIKTEVNDPVINIYNILGFKVNINNRKGNSFDCQHFTRGIYIIEIQHPDDAVTRTKILIY